MLTLGNTTVDASVSNLGRCAELGALLLDLDGKLSGGSKHEDDRTIARGEERLSIDVDHSGKGEGDSLAGSGSGDGDEITTAESHGPGLALDRGGFCETSLLDLGEDVVGETGFEEASDGLWDIWAVDGHSMGFAVLFDFASRSLSDGLVLDVEVLLEACQAAGAPVLLIVWIDQFRALCIFMTRSSPHLFEGGTETAHSVPSPAKAA